MRILMSDTSLLEQGPCQMLCTWFQQCVLMPYSVLTCCMLSSPETYKTDAGSTSRSPVMSSALFTVRGITTSALLTSAIMLATCSKHAFRKTKVCAVRQHDRSLCPQKQPKTKITSEDSQPCSEHATTLDSATFGMQDLHSVSRFELTTYESCSACTHCLQSMESHDFDVCL